MTASCTPCERIGDGFLLRKSCRRDAPAQVDQIRLWSLEAKWANRASDVSWVLAALLCRGRGHGVLLLSGRLLIRIDPTTYLRSDLKPARTSSARSCGCSQAAKCPPLSCFVVVDQVGIRPLRPAPRGRIELVGEDAHSHRDGGTDALDGEERRPPVLPVEAAAGNPVFVNQVIVTLSRMSSRVRPSDCPLKTRVMSS